MDDLRDAALHSGHWTFSKVPFKTSLMAGQTHEFEDISVRMFNSALVYTGLELSGKLCPVLLLAGNKRRHRFRNTRRPILFFSLLQNW